MAPGLSPINCGKDRGNTCKGPVYTDSWHRLGVRGGRPVFISLPAVKDEFKVTQIGVNQQIQKSE